MSIVTPISAWLSTFLPAYDAAKVASVTETVGEPVLWSGRAFQPEAVQASLETLSWCLAGSLAFLLAGVALGVVAYRKDKAAYGFTAAGLGLIGFIGMASFNETFTGTTYVMASRGFVITQNRIVRIDPDDQRSDVPANAVTSIQRRGGIVTIGLVRMTPVEIQAGGAGKAALDGAIERFASNAFKGDGFIGTLNGRT